LTPPASAGAAPGAPPVATIPAPDTAAAAKGKPAPDLLGELAAARAAANTGDPFFYFVQAGAFRTSEDAEAQRAKLSLMGVEAKVTEREQAGRQVFRVRVGPFDKKEEADRQKERLESGGVETALVRVQR
jgi:cell division protein FtsN